MLTLLKDRVIRDRKPMKQLRMLLISLQMTVLQEYRKPTV